ncbi:MAG: hypothetical protein JWN03_2303 [Nocardia sp.]|uniref:hypothetical protein n=1 Tax=Nocardia sp. TaxID=1821 RepID=UPI002614F787|nr:hypothetical protein [Nocardia sp.]MCU1642028.1 hypothetical protein [Nocardia sp.]
MDYEGERSLRVTLEFSDTAHRSLDVQWSAATACKKLEYARIFLVVLGDDPQRVYLNLVDTRPWASVRLPEALAEGEYAIEIDAYGSASWGDGRLDARGRSASFTVV